MFGLETTTVLIILIVVLAVILWIWWSKGDPEIESPRSQMGILERLLHERGFRPLLPMVRSFEKYNECTFLEEVQRQTEAFASDDEYAEQWLAPIMLAGLSLIMGRPDLRMRLDAHLRKEHGWRLKKIRAVDYGIRPEITMLATAEEGDVCFQEEGELQLARGRKTYVQLADKADTQENDQ